MCECAPVIGILLSIAANLYQLKRPTKRTLSMTHKSMKLQLNSIEAHALSNELNERFCIRSKIHMTIDYYFRSMIICAEKIQRENKQYRDNSIQSILIHCSELPIPNQSALSLSL